MTADTIQDVVAAALEEAKAERFEVVAVDMPIGLVDDGLRAADVEARRLLGARRASLFSSPVLTALDDDFVEANRLNRERSGRGLSRQSHALVPKIRYVRQWQLDYGRRVIEVHPEVSFRVLKDAELSWPKKSWNGVHERLTILDQHGMKLPNQIPAIRAVGSDDVIDAAVAAISASRCADEQARQFPENGQPCSDGLNAAIYA